MTETTRGIDPADESVEWEYDGPFAPSGALATRFQGQWVDIETGDPIDGPHWKRRRVSAWEDVPVEEVVP